MRWAQEERRREKKKINKEAEIEEQKKLKDALTESGGVAGSDEMQLIRERVNLIQPSTSIMEKIKAYIDESKQNAATEEPSASISEYANFEQSC